ncbi:MAG: hypothetical protein ACREKI_09035, partial [Gemmatimonadota bacterium]
AFTWAFEELRAAGRFSLRLSDGLRFGSLVWVTLVPATAIASFFRAVGLHEALGAWEVPALVALALATGGWFGWTLTRRRRAAAALAVATVTVTLAMGGPIPIVNSARASTLFVAFLGVYAISGLVLVPVLTVLVGGFVRAACERSSLSAQRDRVSPSH